jgi:serralysin
MTTKRLTNGNDTYTTKDGDEFVYALKGNDKITIKGFFYDVENDATRVTVYGAEGDDQIVSELSMSGQIAYGGPGNDRIVMQGGDDDGGLAYGGGGNDVLICKGGDEGCGLNGGAGADQLINQGEYYAGMSGGPGRDRFTTSPGSLDRLRFEKGDTVSGSQRDVVKGFIQDEDEIQLSGIDANTKISGDQAFTFVASTKHPAVGEVSCYKSGTSTIVVANDGSSSFEIELQEFDQPLLATDFGL